MADKESTKVDTNIVARIAARRHRRPKHPERLPVARQPMRSTQSTTPVTSHVRPARPSVIVSNAKSIPRANSTRRRARRAAHAKKSLLHRAWRRQRKGATQCRLVTEMCRATGPKTKSGSEVAAKEATMKTRSCRTSTLPCSKKVLACRPTSSPSAATTPPGLSRNSATSGSARARA